MRNEAGFTLVEVLVALVITSFLLAVIMNGAVSARERGAAAQARRDAVLLARHLAASAIVARYAEGVRKGSEGPLEWRVDEDPAALDPRGRFVLARISISIVDRVGRELFSAETRKLKPLVIQ